jgi:succinate dehydrogenase / fumarate reductase cytochrome b subunit
MAVKDARPRYLNLFKIRLPVTGIISIFHRFTGILLFLAIPASLYLLQMSVQDIKSFHHVLTIFNEPLIRFLLLMIVWSLVHHLFTGVRFLLIDFDIGVSRKGSRLSAWLVVAVETAVMLFILSRLFV